MNQAVDPVNSAGGAGHLLWSGTKLRSAAGALYGTAVGQARLPVLYTRAAVPDTIDGRFDMIALHVFLILQRLKAEAENRRLSQAVFDLMFDDMDESLREMGVGDLGVGRRVKIMAKAMYGRIAAYEEALAAASPKALGEALKRNVYRGQSVDGGTVDWLVGYIRRQVAALETQPMDKIVAGQVVFALAESD